MIIRITFFVAILLIGIACSKEKSSDKPKPPVFSKVDWAMYFDTSYTEEKLYDRILGTLLGSAIGDAMGAPTEMWHKNDIAIDYGFVDSLTRVFREASPEGPWDMNLPAGGTTDDTRWKHFAVQFLIQSEAKRSPRAAPLLNPRNFAQEIVNQYLSEIESLKTTDSFEPEPFEISARRMAWLQEWALVAKPYAEGNIDEYAYALHHFYGGEMTCAGMLYAPIIGAFYPGKPEIAYEEAYKLGLFDLGYARDITALTAAMTAAALHSQPSQDSILDVIISVDPNDYFKSRLVSRVAYRWLWYAKRMVYEANQITKEDLPGLKLKLPKNYPYDSLYFARTQKVYESLDEHLQDAPFHAGEIHLINLTALVFSEMDFQKSIEFVTNYGRDNDTVGAITGAIAGAYCGASKLPLHLKAQVLKVNKEQLNIDIEQLAKELTALIIRRKDAM
ncbi:MAG: ADP-ribosylglycohydrolase family protein [Saprospiraceae bacterium]|nr:ADP-ribosylglycohydrolase family protein [Saprospiraceae bacterium]